MLHAQEKGNESLRRFGGFPARVSSTQLPCIPYHELWRWFCSSLRTQPPNIPRAWSALLPPCLRSLSTACRALVVPTHRSLPSQATGHHHADFHVVWSANRCCCQCLPLSPPENRSVGVPTHRPQLLRESCQPLSHLMSCHVRQAPSRSFCRSLSWSKRASRIASVLAV